MELGEGDRLVGCTTACEPGREVKRIAWQGARALEAIVRLQPGLVIRQAPRTAEDPLRDALEGAGIKVLSLPSETIADVRAAILRIGEALEQKDRSRRYVERFDAALARSRAAVKGRPRPRVLFVFGRDAGNVANIDAAGPGSFLDELVRCAGGKNVLADRDSPYPKVSLEQIVRLGPEVIIDNVPGGEDPMEAWREFPTLPAVKHERVYAVRDRDLLIPGPRLPRAVERLVEMIHGRP